MPSLNLLEASFIRLLKSDSYYGYNRSLGHNYRNKEVAKYKNKAREYS
ncbi:MAG: hypothetical protein LBD63_02575 [Mycoplasmataceae bacterium]|jgi:hypothetical protein|nr:hypothetical protein [Mycoplasmataceae bacterium]